MQAITKLVTHGRSELAKVIVGQSELVDGTLTALLCGGHALIEGVPGLGKTLSVKVLARAFNVTFQRVQCTSDLMPADLLGSNILNLQNGTFSLHRGPMFTDLLLVDEINRMPPRTQASLLESMEERQVTIDGVRHSLSPLFTVLATQNPVEFEGTYPLPEAQLDRFLLKVLIPNPTEDELCEVLARTTGRAPEAPHRVLAQKDVLALRTMCRDVAVAEPVARYAARLVRASDPSAKEAPDLAKRLQTP